VLNFLSNLFYEIKEAVQPSPIPPWIQIAKREIGIKEFRGSENPEILKYFKATSLKASEDEVPWCSAAACWILDKCGMEHPHSAAARSHLSYGTRLSAYRKYCLVVLKRGNSTWQGHVGFATERRGRFIQVLGGNQQDEFNYSYFPATQVLGYIWPKPKTDLRVLRP
jgi:uncharacterized protein (TIGR02594 family)